MHDPGAKHPPSALEVWDLFIDELDRSGQAGSAADVLVPSLLADAPSGRRFGELTRIEIQALVALGGRLGREATSSKTSGPTRSRKSRLKRERTAAR